MNAQRSMSLAAQAGVGAPPISEAEFDLFRKLMRDAAGIHLAPAKQALVVGRLSRRLRELGHRSFGEYFNWLSRPSADPAARAERQLAIDLLTTNETYFFREPRHFDFIHEQILPSWRDRRVRLWSAACSSGEEAYTLGMLLAVHGRCEWEIHGTDISTRVIETARRGIYPMARAERIPERYLKACCLKGVGSQAGNFLIDSKIRRRTRFAAGNLLDNLSALGTFDLIMLRNVLIYFDPEVKRQVALNILRQLRPGGWLMVGHAESLGGLVPGLETVLPSVYRRGGPQ